MKQVGGCFCKFMQFPRCRARDWSHVVLSILVGRRPERSYANKDTKLDA